MKLSHKSILLRIRLNFSQARLANEIRTSQSQLSDFEQGHYRKISQMSYSLLLRLINKHVDDIDYNDLSWEEMATLKLKVNRIKVSDVANKLVVPVSAVSEVLKGNNANVSPSRERRIKSHLDGIGLF